MTWPGRPGSPNAAEAVLSKMPKAELHPYLGPLRPAVGQARVVASRFSRTVLVTGWSGPR
jgi:hypothetical protein